MKSWDDFISEDTDASLDSRVAQKVESELHSFRLKKRRNLLTWLIPATMSALGTLFWIRQQNVEDTIRVSENTLLEDASLLDEQIDTETLAIFEDLEMLENLEVLEQWNS